MDKFRVTIHVGNDYGYIEYDPDEKNFSVVLANEEKRQQAIEFLSREHNIHVPHSSLRDFTEEKIDPLASLENFKIVLTRLWVATSVFVDWSYPHIYAQNDGVCG